MKCIALLLFAVFCPLAHAQLPDSLSVIFKYAKTTVPKYATDSTFVRNGIRVERITYISTDDFVVSAYITHPKKKKKNPLVVFVHWGEGTKDEFLDEAVALSAKNVLCLLPDNPWLCPNSKLTSFTRQGEELHRQSVMNIRKALDLAEQQLQIDSTKINCTGHSFGCNTAAILSGVENRIKSYVFMTGIYNGTKSISQSQLPDFVEWRANKPQEFKRLVKALRPFDASAYLPYKTVPCLIQAANQDEYISQDENQQFIDGTPSPKEVKKYDATHRLDTAALRDRKSWILQHLAL